MSHILHFNNIMAVLCSQHVQFFCLGRLVFFRIHDNLFKLANLLLVTLTHSLVFFVHFFSLQSQRFRLFFQYLILFLKICINLLNLFILSFSKGFNCVVVFIVGIIYLQRMLTLKLRRIKLFFSNNAPVIDGQPLHIILKKIIFLYE